MGQTATHENHARTSHGRSAGRSISTFTQLFAIGAAIFYSLLFTGAAIAMPELVGSPVAWTLWLIVTTASVATYAAGLQVSRESKRSGRHASTRQSHRMRHWLKSDHS